MRLVLPRPPVAPARRGATTRGPMPRGGFSLVELLAVVAIVGTLLGLVLPAVHHARESSRRAACGTNVRQAALGVCGYESARRRFPAGCDLVPRGPIAAEGTQHAWSSFILPHIEHDALARRIDYARPWNAPGGNAAAVRETVATYVCPSGIVAAAGRADYGGISGSWIISAGVPFLGAAGLASGILVADDGTHRAVVAAEVTDGLGRTLLIAEAVDRADAAVPASDPQAAGRWARINCFAQAAAFVNALGSDIASHHPGGALAACGDGRVTFLDDSMDPAVLAALCTRNGGEADGSPPDG